MAGALGVGGHEIEIEYGGRERFYLVHVPPQAAGGAPLPVVLNFHGGGGTPEAHRDWTELPALADREGFLAVHPGGTPGRLFSRRLLTWNAGDCCGPAQREGVDDVGFVLALLVDLAQRTPVDASRVYATGLSNGGMMAYRLAHDAADRIAAVAPVAGAARFEPFAPARPVPVLHFHSVDDPRALYAGGLGPPFPLTRTRVEHPPVTAVLAQWWGAAGCAPDPETGPVRRWAAPGGAEHTATRLTWRGCAGGLEVALWRMTGAGHVWPGRPPRYRERLLGPATEVLDANAEIWAFFRRFARPEAPPPAPGP